jgi:chromatin remodeling complex protein RSC6
MSKQTKASKATKASEVTETPAPIVAPAPVVAAPTETVTKVKKVKSTKADAVAAPAAAVVAPVVVAPAPVVAAPVAEAVTEDVAEVQLDATLVEKTKEHYDKLQQLASLISSMKTEFKTLEKQWSRELKAAQKQSSKRKRKSGNRAPSGFVKPTKISDELALFLEKPAGSEMARTEVTRDINKYIRTNLLQDKENGRKIIPDAKLSALLKIKKDEELTYFNLQRYMSPHFSKADKTVTVSA